MKAEKQNKVWKFTINGANAVSLSDFTMLKTKFKEEKKDASSDRKKEIDAILSTLNRRMKDIEEREAKLILSSNKTRSVTSGAALAANQT